MLTLLCTLATAGDRITPTFAWAPGDVWTVAFERTSSRAATGNAYTARTAASWTMTVSGSVGALVVRASNYSFGGTTGLPANDVREGANATAAAAAPSFRLDATGAIIEMLDAAVTPRAASDWWDGLVPTWRGGTLVRGQPDSLVLRTPVTQLGNREVQNDAARVYDGSIPCAPGGAATCESFTLRARLNPSDLTLAVSDHSRSVASAQGGPPGLVVDSLASDSLTTLVTEADDLRPRRLHTQHNVHLVGHVGKNVIETTQTESRTWSFTRR
ncbi:MAG: hypothetical protein EXR71_11165 [Myxococcales bacterium]|nr:hypothetical protein [Myxococcales bacterium]